eukprot:TRINITY_DN1260_c1_g1_i4.p2 TRINITY_DN1260_c1_g1~~TRINITY_DN1260_c1_g1_i4.p2  ORF type:complete len:172 (+),score=36.16 TRINITY_DN1260_c1_g1_i4:147-662(+)
MNEYNNDEEPISPSTSNMTGYIQSQSGYLSMNPYAMNAKKRKHPGYSIQKWKINEEEEEDLPVEKKQKREHSNQVKKVKERERRSKMTESVQELRSLLPQCRQSDRKFNQAMVMSMAVEYISHLLDQIQTLEDKILKSGLESPEYNGRGNLDLGPDFSQKNQTSRRIVTRL